MKKNTLLFISWVLGLCEIGIMLYFFTENSIAYFAKSFGSAVAYTFFLALIMTILPIHVIIVVINIVAWISSNKMIALVASILYLIEGVIGISFMTVVFSLLLLAQAILCFIAFIKMKQVNNITVDNNSEAISNNESSNNNESAN